MPPVKGGEWKHIEIVDGEAGKQPKVRCLYCSRVFVGGAVRIRNHLIGGGGMLNHITQCTEVPDGTLWYFMEFYVWGKFRNFMEFYNGYHGTEQL